MESGSTASSQPDAGFDANRQEDIRNDLARRLRRICANFPDEEFDQLIQDMTERQLRSERRPIT